MKTISTKTNSTQTSSHINSRREFIKTSASLALGLALPPLALQDIVYAKKSAQGDLKTTLKPPRKPPL